MVKAQPRLVLIAVGLSFITLGLIIKNNFEETKSFKPSANSSGNVQGANISLPGNFPEDLPFYSNSTVLSSLTNAENSQASVLIPESSEKVRGFYSASLPARGWSSQDNQKFVRDSEILEVSFTESGQTKTLLLLNYSRVPTK